MKVRITVAGKEFEAEFDDNDTADAVAELLPIEANASVWGDEIYFEIPVSLAQNPDAIAEVPVGAIAYWPPGNAMCIFFGPTPVSTGDTPRAYSPVNEFGRIISDATELRGVRNGARVTVEKA
ncbi:MAG: cyclophilin-like fold protein [Caldilineaceae bacterium]|jgi:hypothetical protein